MYQYNISFHDTMHTTKPTGAEIGNISNHLVETQMDYKELAHAVGEAGCSFCPAVYHGKRRAENFKSQQLIGLDFDNGVPFHIIQQKAEHYHLKILFAYRTFSDTAEHEKFRIVFALQHKITDSFTARSVVNIFMKIFENCDEACKDSARLFFGGKGLRYLADEPHEISQREIILALAAYMADKYDNKHYTRELQKFYAANHIRFEKNHPVTTDQGSFISESSPQTVRSHASDKPKNGRRQVTRNLDWNTLYDRCRLYRDFFDGSEYYYYPELLHIATNLINIEKGKTQFLHILQSEQNAGHESYHQRNWGQILHMLIEMDYQPASCHTCPYGKDCLHAKNMVLTAKPGHSTILPIQKQEYVSIEEAELDLENQFLKAIRSQETGLHILKAQTGIGKTSLYLKYIQTHPNEKFLIAVPTHQLKAEIYAKALCLGVKDIRCTPELPCFSEELKGELEHLYRIGAGAYVGNYLTEYSKSASDTETAAIRNYLDDLAAIKTYDGNIITTHERILLENKNSSLFQGRTVLIDEDILRAMVSVKSISNEDILRVMHEPFLSAPVYEKLQKVLLTRDYQKFTKEECPAFDVEMERFQIFESIEGDISALCSSRCVYNDGTTTSFIVRKSLSCEKAVILSATAQTDIYRMYTMADVYDYPCKMAAYQGRLELDTSSTYSRYALAQDGMIDKMKKGLDSDAVITFLCAENAFHTKYHYGAIEGLNCLEGKNIAVIGLPNISDVVYILYGMAAGMRAETYPMQSMRNSYNGYDFRIKTFSSDTLRKIHLWMLESHLEQAIGRARLLRYPCTVKVFARFPVSQAIML